MTRTVEQVVTQVPQEILTLKAQVADQSGLAGAVRALNNLATAQGKKDTSSLIDVKGLGRPKEFSGKDEDFQQWLNKTEAFFAGVIKESEMMLEWSAEHDDRADRSWIPTDFEERGVCKCRVRAAADAHSTHGSHEL